jgi:hypothetical protein
VPVLDESAFADLLETGELPDPGDAAGAGRRDDEPAGTGG